MVQFFIDFQKLMLRNFEGLHHFQENDSFGYSAKAYQVWKV